MPVSDFIPVIGLEVHAQLLTRSKIFCGCSTAFGAPPNHQTCPVCLGLPGALPVLNARVVELAIRAGLALGCSIQSTSTWARKNYFYPDLPKGYQITQYDAPICTDGALAVEAGQGQGDGERRVRIRRIHLEEDAGKSVHQPSGGLSLVDLNRAGVPLIEIVSEPDLRGSDEAAEYLRALRDILVYLDVNDGNLEEGSFRCDANVSVMRAGADRLGTRVELKNINSFRFVKQAIDYEVQRQVDVLEGGGAVLQETRLWDAQRGQTRPMRSKEEAHDYRYFPEPDLPSLRVSDALIAEVRASLPELPQAKMARLRAEHGLSAYEAKVLCADRALVALFEATLRSYANPKRLAGILMGEVLRLSNERGEPLTQLRFSPGQLADLLGRVDAGSLSLAGAKEVLVEMFKTGGDPAAIIAARGLGQETDAAAVEAVIDQVLAANASQVEAYRAGKTQVFGFLVGQCMKAMRGKGNPALVNELLKRKL